VTGPEMLAVKQLIDKARRAQLARQSAHQIGRPEHHRYKRPHRMKTDHTFAQRGLDREVLRAQVLELAATGHSVYKIADQVGVSKSTAHNWIVGTRTEGRYP
jgi:ATP/maltotriose-dependent transcriptional regulator MalT